MKHVCVLVAVCFLVCGCLSLEEAAIVRAARMAGPSLAVGRVAPDVPENIGVIFDWNSTSAPLRGAYGLGSVVRFGSSDIYIGKRSTSFVFANGGIKLGGESYNSRLQVGTGSEAAPGNIIGGEPPSDTYHPNGGQFNLSEGTFRLTVAYRDAVAAADSNYPLLRIYLNNVGEITASVLGGKTNGMGADLLCAFGTVSGLQNPASETDGIKIAGTNGELIVTFTPATMYGNLAASSPVNFNSLKTAYFTLFTSTRAGITVTGIKLERIQ